MTRTQVSQSLSFLTQKNPLRCFFSFFFTFVTFSAGFLIWNYYVTMPMPASTFTLAVGHWQQVTAEIPLESGEGLGEGADWGKTAKLRAEPRHWTEAELVSGLGCSTAKVATGSPVLDSRYFINFPLDLPVPAIFHRKHFLKWFIRWIRCSTHSNFMTSTLNLQSRCPGKKKSLETKIVELSKVL